MALIVKTIGSAGGRDFATIALWIASLPANLVTDGNSYEGDCYNDPSGEFTGAPGAGAIATFPATTTDSTHTITLTTGAGQSFQDNASVRTNALKYNVSNGVGIRKTDNYGAVITFSGAVNFITVSKLQLSRSAVGSGGALVSFTSFGSNHLWKDIIGEVTGTSGVAFACGGGTAVRIENVVIIIRSTATVTPIQAANNSPTLIGCGVVRPSNFTAAGTGFNRTYGTPILQSSYSFGFTTASSSGWDSTNSKNNGTDQSSIVGGSAQVSITYNSTTPLTSAADSTRDLRSIASTSLAANGFKDATNAPNDISGSLRPSTPTIGPWEISPASATTPNQFPRVL